MPRPRKDADDAPVDEPGAEDRFLKGVRKALETPHKPHKPKKAKPVAKKKSK